MPSNFDGGLVSNAAEYGQAISRGVIDKVGQLFGTNAGWLIDKSQQAGVPGILARGLWQSISGKEGSGFGGGSSGGGGAGGGFPFRGGQCETRYNVQVQMQSLSNPFSCNDPPQYFPSPSGATLTNVWGPITQIKPVRVHNDLCPGREQFGGFAITSKGRGSTPLAVPQQEIVGLSSADTLGPLLNVNVTPVPGTSDDCGNPPPPEPDYPVPTEDDRAVDIDIEINNNEGPNINLTIPVVIVGVAVNVKGEVEVEVNLEADSLVKIPVEIEPTINIGIGGSEGLENPDPGEELPTPRPELTICGVIVVTSAPGPSFRETFLSGGNTYYNPRLGSVSFVLKLPSGTFETEEFEVHKSRVFIPVPDTCFEVVGYNSNPYLGTEWSVIPVYGYNDVVTQS